MPFPIQYTILCTVGTWLFYCIEVLLQKGHSHDALCHSGRIQLLFPFKNPRASSEAEQPGSVVVLPWICRHVSLISNHQQSWKSYNWQPLTFEHTVVRLLVLTAQGLHELRGFASFVHLLNLHAACAAQTQL